MDNTITQERSELIKEWCREKVFFNNLPQTDVHLVLNMRDLGKGFYYTNTQAVQLNRIRQEWIDWRNCVVSNS